MQITINDIHYRGTPENLIKVMEACGYEAERNERNPHLYWQWAEYLKKKNGK